MSYKLIKGAAVDLDWFRKANKGWEPTGDLLYSSSPGSESCTYVVFTGSYTRHLMCRDCGDHFIIAKHDRYDRIDKETMKVTEDVEDV